MDKIIQGIYERFGLPDLINDFDDTEGFLVSYDKKLCITVFKLEQNYMVIILKQTEEYKQIKDFKEPNKENLLTKIFEIYDTLLY